MSKLPYGKQVTTSAAHNVAIVSKPRRLLVKSSQQDTALEAVDDNAATTGRATEKYSGLEKDFKNFVKLRSPLSNGIHRTKKVLKANRT